MMTGGCTQRKVVLSVDNKHNDINLLFTRKDGCCLDAVRVKTRRVNQSNINRAIVQQTLFCSVNVLRKTPEHGKFRTWSVLLSSKDILKISKCKALDVIAADHMYFLNTIIFALCITNLAKHRSTRLLVRRHELAAQKRIDKRRLASVQITRYEHLALRVADTHAKVRQVLLRAAHAFVKQLSHGRLLQ